MDSLTNITTRFDSNSRVRYSSQSQNNRSRTRDEILNSDIFKIYYSDCCDKLNNATQKIEINAYQQILNNMNIFLNVLNKIDLSKAINKGTALSQITNDIIVNLNKNIKQNESRYALIIAYLISVVICYKRGYNLKKTYKQDNDLSPNIPIKWDNKIKLKKCNINIQTLLQNIIITHIMIIDKIMIDMFYIPMHNDNLLSQIYKVFIILNKYIYYPDPGIYETYFRFLYHEYIIDNTSNDISFFYMNYHQLYTFINETVKTHNCYFDTLFNRDIRLRKIIKMILEAEQYRGHIRSISRRRTNKIIDVYQQENV